MQPLTKVVYILSMMFVHDYDAHLFMIYLYDTEEKILDDTITWNRK